ncbi:hypothetical protein KIPB_004205 [Kipferlia bialata]|uniref:SET domain-containing protein n=1 Tax=Kipferlia bialata TaxID=797122 RepID=A0A9K3CV29_9EUKA|nr:hypothetical protein KIPB_004205 [Kipferlia bialata]|eukprot:g4205.t1
MTSRFNHSCCPNVTQRHQENGDMTSRAVRDISEGEELCISYLKDYTGPSAQRQGWLKQGWKFDCGCETCSLEPEALAQSDAIRAEMQLCQAEFEPCICTGQYQKCYEYGLRFLDIVEAAAAIHRPDLVIGYLQLCYQHSVYTNGPTHPITRDYASAARDPSSRGSLKEVASYAGPCPDLKGAEPSMDAVCVDMGPDTVTSASTTGCWYLQFDTLDSECTGTGFSCDYTSHLPTTTEGTVYLADPSGTIDNPYYYNAQDTQWVIAPANVADIQIECAGVTAPGDSLSLYTASCDGQSVTGTTLIDTGDGRVSMSHDVAFSTLGDDGNCLSLAFSADADYLGASGFSCTYTSTAFDTEVYTLSDTAGNVSNQRYVSNQKGTWRVNPQVSIDSGALDIQDFITFDPINVYGDSQCLVLEFDPSPSNNDFSGFQCDYVLQPYEQSTVITDDLGTITDTRYTFSEDDTYVVHPIDSVESVSVSITGSLSARTDTLLVYGAHCDFAHTVTHPYLIDTLTNTISETYGLSLDTSGSSSAINCWYLEFKTDSSPCGGTGFSCDYTSVLPTPARDPLWTLVLVLVICIVALGATLCCVRCCCRPKRRGEGYTAVPLKTPKDESALLIEQGAVPGYNTGVVDIASAEAVEEIMAAAKGANGSEDLSGFSHNARF